MTKCRPLLLLTSILLGCAGGQAPVMAPSPVAEHPEPGKEVLWVRDSAEYVAVVVQTFRLAERRIEELASGREQGRWAVMMDADETVISNLDYSLGRVEEGGAWSQESWSSWVEAGRATVLPGAIGFIDRVRELGGRVVIVTNRSQADCDATRRNLLAVGVSFDHLRCKDAESDKARRWEEVRTGDGTGLGPLEIVMWIGDNIHDFPGLAQSARGADLDAFEEFGDRFFLLPNPLYGSWEDL
jgi:5'-nucleotidase (lipoprotein e(P4) family)